MSESEKAVMKKVTRRLIPFLFVLYIIAYLDRTNIAFAQIGMQPALKMSNTVFGYGKGIFFLGYFLFEVPSNLMMVRFGARRWITRIMVTWGLIAMAMMFIKTPSMFYILRFLLGVAEAGFFPGVILYLTYWFTAAERGRIIALFMTAIATSNVIGSPVSTFILQKMDQFKGLAGWKWCS